MLSLNILFFIWHFLLSIIQKLRKESIVMATKHANLSCFVVIADDKDFFY